MAKYTISCGTAHVLPLSKQDLEPIWQNEQDFLKKFKKLGQNFIWKGNPQIPNKETTCPIRQGGLNIVDVGYKALTLRLSQLKLILDSTNFTTGARFGRYWLAKQNAVLNTQPHFHFIKKYTIKDGIDGETGLNHVAAVLKSNCINHLYSIENLYPASKKIYKTLNAFHNAPERKESLFWNTISIEISIDIGQKVVFQPDFTQIWKNLSPPHMQETMWKIYKFIRVYKERNFLKAKNENRDAKNIEKCVLCVDTHPSRESHLHLFSKCQYTQLVWDHLEEIILKIDPNPPNKLIWFLGQSFKSTSSRLFNTLVVITNHQIWISRCNNKFEKKLIPPNNLAKKVKAVFMLRLAMYFQIYKKRRKLEQFKKKFLLRSLFIIRENILEFNF